MKSSKSQQQDFRNIKFLHKTRATFPKSAVVHTPPLALLTKDTVLATISGTSLKYGKLLVYKWNKYSSELILFPYRGTFTLQLSRARAVFSYKSSGSTWNNHAAHPAHFRQGEIQTTATNVLGKGNSQEHETKISSETKAYTTTHYCDRPAASCGAEGQWRSAEVHMCCGGSFAPTARHFLQSGGLSAEQRVNAPAVTVVSWHSSSGFDS